MSIASSVISLIFITCLVHTALKSKAGFEYKWELLRYYFSIGIPAYLVFWDMFYGVRIAILGVFVTNITRILLKTDKRLSLVLNLVNVIIIIIAVNMLKNLAVSEQTYIGLSFLFGAFFTSFFDSVLVFKDKFRMRILFLGIGHLLIFHLVWSIFEMRI